MDRETLPIKSAYLYDKLARQRSPLKHAFYAKRNINGTEVHFYGVTHTSAVFRGYKPYFERIVQDADVLVLEADKRVMEAAKVGPECPPSEFAQFFSSIDSFARGMGKDVRCLEKTLPESLDKGSTLDNRVSIRATAGLIWAAAPVLFFSALSELMDKFSFSNLAVAIGTLAVSVLFARPAIWGLIDAYNDMRYDFKFRNVSVASGLLKLVKEESPKKVTVIYGSMHVGAILAYLKHPDILESHVKRFDRILDGNAL